ncbi:hypothetical protein ACSQ67_004011 [Phaseolus vulgaris]
MFVAGDTFPLGRAFDESNIHHKYFKNNPDYQCPAYKTKNGIYNEGCGSANVMMSWGHDEYMYLVAKKNGSTLPSAGLFIIDFTLSIVAKENDTTLPFAGLFIIGYHSFYPLHKEGAYTHLMNEEDFENLKWLEAKRMREIYVTLDKAEMGIWECCELPNEVVDDGDLDLDEAQIQHLLQSAEAIERIILIKIGCI